MSFVLGATWLAFCIWATDHAAVLCLAVSTTVGPQVRAQRPWESGRPAGTSNNT